MSSQTTIPMEDVRSELSAEGIARFKQGQIDRVYGHVARSAVISSVLACALAVYLAPTFGVAHARDWLILKILVSVARLAMAFLYKRRRIFVGQPDLAYRAMLVALAIDGLVWGIPGIMAIQVAGEVSSLVVAVLASVALLATHGLASDVKATLSYVLPMLVPVAIAMPFRGDGLGLFAAGGLVLVVVQSVVTGVSTERQLRKHALDQENSERSTRERIEALAEVARGREAVEHALREVKRQSAVKALFLGTMSHELRTPLHGILGLTQLVRQQLEDPVAQHRLGLVESSGNHLLELIGALLDISRIDSGRLELRKVPFDLAAELRTLAELYEFRCQGKGVEFRAVLELDTRCMVEGDAARIRQILHNLLGNAVKFTSSGLIALKATRDGDSFEFIITDTGPGIAAKDQERIFEAFTQVDDSATRPADGTGLGLTIARELAHAMGGDITVSSALGVGSRFTFSAVLPEATSEPVEVPVKVEVPNLRPGFRVLLVEDNEVNAMIAQAHLENLGAEAVWAHDGGEAVTLAFAEPRPDFILMDNRMPVMDGPTATRKIRLIEKQASMKRVPIVALTATMNEDDRRECYDSGMDGILTKPFNAIQLLQIISIYAVNDRTGRRHPLYELATSLEDMEPDLYIGRTMH